MEQLEKLFKDTLSGETLVRMVFSAKRRKSLEYSRVVIRPVKVSGRIGFQVEYTFEKKVTHKNLEADEAFAEAMRLLTEDFKQINIFTVSEDIQILASKPSKPRITTKPATRGVPSLEHNRTKKYAIPNGIPCDFLIRLGVMDTNGKVLDRHYSKFRQINRYLEIVEDVFPYLPKDKTLKIIDFGCGKAYLTFALYHYLKIVKKRNVEIIGLDLKKDVIDFCSKIASDLGYDELKFLMGDIADYTDDNADMVVTLHACDTATDYALINAVSWNTEVILSVPCCQHELFSQIRDEIHQPMLKHGILKDRLTEYLTDGLRGLKLEAAGYDVAMIEFTSLEHTARNIMIKAVKTGTPDSPASRRARKQYEALRDFYHVNPTIDKL
ncbi:MAG: SAM-dependent methyltransferase [Eubacteriaceae bacterium]|nr:SAM-dependent methyltransferase [Eubacteriaceae bacterium]